MTLSGLKGSEVINERGGQCTNGEGKREEEAIAPSLSSQFKFNAALRAVKEARTTSQGLQKCAIHTNRPVQWKNLLLDQGARFTVRTFSNVLGKAGARVSMDGRRRAFGNVFIERLWRSVKHEGICLTEHESGPESLQGKPPLFTHSLSRR